MVHIPQQSDVIWMPTQQYTDTKHTSTEYYHLVVSSLNYAWIYVLNQKSLLDFVLPRSRNQIFLEIFAILCSKMQRVNSVMIATIQWSVRVKHNKLQKWRGIDHKDWDTGGIYKKW